MFTGIITEVGRVREVSDGDDKRVVIETATESKDTKHGASIACSGACLTLVDKGAGWFAFDVSAETLACTTLNEWQSETPVNLEFSLQIGDELGGHMVSGHVDGVGSVVGRTEKGGSLLYAIEAPECLSRFIAPKGSIAVDGVSLTVNEVEGRRFGVNIIPHTGTVTTLGGLNIGDRVNLEIDMLARYVARLLDVSSKDSEL